MEELWRNGGGAVEDYTDYTEVERREDGAPVEAGLRPMRQDVCGEWRGVGGLERFDGGRAQRRRRCRNLAGAWKL